MEIGDLLFAQFPAEVNFAALVVADEIHQTRLEIFQLAANLGKFIEVSVKLVDRDVEVLLDAFLILCARGFEARLKLCCLFACLNDVVDNAAHQGERQGEATTVPMGLASFAYDFKPIRKFAERDHSNIVHWNDYDRGGHWAAHDAPDLLLGDIRAFFRKVA